MAFEKKSYEKDFSPFVTTEKYNTIYGKTLKILKLSNEINNKFILHIDNFVHLSMLPNFVAFLIKFNIHI